MSNEEIKHYRCIHCGKSLKGNVVSMRNHLRKELKGLTDERIDVMIFYIMNPNPRGMLRNSNSEEFSSSFIATEFYKAYRARTLRHRLQVKRAKRPPAMKRWKPPKVKRVRSRVNIKRKPLSEATEINLRTIAKKDLEMDDQHSDDVKMAMGMRYLLKKSMKALDAMQVELNKNKESDLQSEPNELQ